jgi:phosphoribosyl 1,2-cyclic phosphodiesterase
MLIISLQSGSQGNCVYVETQDGKFLFDACISGKRAEERLARHGRNIRDVDALFITHEHTDHIQNLGVFQRKFGLKAVMTKKTLAAANPDRLGKLGEIVHFTPGERLTRGETTIHSIPTPHDAADGVAFVIDDGRRRFGLLTDLGCPFPHLTELMPTLDAVLLESNYDPGMLEGGPYPWYLQERIRGPRGHLSNEESANLLRGRSVQKMQWCCLGHISENNNAPDVALDRHRELLDSDLPLFAAPYRDTSEAMTVE